jgi:hypothetical protein
VSVTIPDGRVPKANGGMLNREALAKMQLSPSTNADASV